MNSLKIRRYKLDQLPSDDGIYVEAVKGKIKSFIPSEAIRISSKLRNVRLKRKNPDKYSEERMDKTTRAVDSSDETLGG